MHREVDRVGIVRPLARGAQGFGLDELNSERVGKSGDDIDLQPAEFAALALEPVGPDMGAGLGRDELRVDLHFLAGAAHAAFEQIAHAELFADRLRVDRLADVTP